MDEYDGIGEAPEQTRNLLRRAGRGFLEITERRALIGKTQLADIGEHVRACSLRSFTVTIWNHRRINAARSESLSDCGGIAENPHLEIVFLRIDAELIQGDHRLQPETAAYALHAEGLAAQILQCADFFAGHQFTRNFLHR